MDAECPVVALAFELGAAHMSHARVHRSDAIDPDEFLQRFAPSGTRTARSEKALCTKDHDGSLPLHLWLDNLKCGASDPDQLKRFRELTPRAVRALTPVELPNKVLSSVREPEGLTPFGLAIHLDVAELMAPCLAASSRMGPALAGRSPLVAAAELGAARCMKEITRLRPAQRATDVSMALCSTIHSLTVGDMHVSATRFGASSATYDHSTLHVTLEPPWFVCNQALILYKSHAWVYVVGDPNQTPSGIVNLRHTHTGDTSMQLCVPAGDPRRIPDKGERVVVRTTPHRGVKGSEHSIIFDSLVGLANAAPWHPYDVANIESRPIVMALLAGLPPALFKKLLDRVPTGFLFRNEAYAPGSSMLVHRAIAHDRGQCLSVILDRIVPICLDRPVARTEMRILLQGWARMAAARWSIGCFTVLLACGATEETALHAVTEPFDDDADAAEAALTKIVALGSIQWSHLLAAATLGDLERVEMLLRDPDGAAHLEATICTLSGAQNAFVRALSVATMYRQFRMEEAGPSEPGLAATALGEAYARMRCIGAAQARCAGMLREVAAARGHAGHLPMVRYLLPTKTQRARCETFDRGIHARTLPSPVRDAIVAATMAWSRLVRGHEDVLRHHLLPFLVDAKDAPVYKARAEEHERHGKKRRTTTRLAEARILARVKRIRTEGVNGGGTVR